MKWLEWMKSREFIRLITRLGLYEVQSWQIEPCPTPSVRSCKRYISYKVIQVSSQAKKMVPRSDQS